MRIRNGTRLRNELLFYLHCTVLISTFLLYTHLTKSIRHRFNIPALHFHPRPPVPVIFLTHKRLVHGLPEDLSRIVLANFNKADKLDPESFFLWMQVLRRVPGCVLWLLEPTAGDSEVSSYRD